MLPGTICSGFIQKVAGTVENIGISDAGFDLYRAVWQFKIGFPAMKTINSLPSSFTI